MNKQLLLLSFIDLFLLFISAIAKSECDTIRFNPKIAWFKSNYWLSKKDISKRSWLFKYPLSFMWDGWHLMDSTRNYCLSLIVLIPFILALNLSWYFVIIISILIYITYGLIFELFYKN